MKRKWEEKREREEIGGRMRLFLYVEERGNGSTLYVTVHRRIAISISLSLSPFSLIPSQFSSILDQAPPL